MTFDYDRLARTGFDAIVIEYNGSNDEGWINHVFGRPASEDISLASDLIGELEQKAYDLLEDNYGGWEINEGSSGEIVIDLKERKTYLNHNWVVESTRSENIELV
jgi:hypothetical protein